MNFKTLSKQVPAKSATGQHVKIDGEVYFRIADSQTMAPFFMSLIGPSDHWMFIASNGALTAGRQNSENALFPYYSSDKLIDLANSSGPTSIVRTTNAMGEEVNWEPFSDFQRDSGCIRNLYKNLNGSKLHFEELNPALELIFRYSWEFSDQFGFVRTCHLANVGSVSKHVSIIDGIQNVLPYGMGKMFQLRFSNLGDAYKKCELLDSTQLGLFYLNSIPTDRAEPSEGLRATVVWQAGLEHPRILLSERQLDQFRNGKTVQSETDIRGKRGAYFVNSSFELPAMDFQSWTMVADLKYDQADVANLNHKLEHCDDPLAEVAADIKQGTAKLESIVSAADGIQASQNRLRTHRHRSNVIFNLMRGGTPVQGYDIRISDFVNHVRLCNGSVYRKHNDLLSCLAGPSMNVHDFLGKIRESNDVDLIRISTEYLPFSFARRHGDPTRPWNKFSIDLKDEEGEYRLNYEGNWRDIFQNWEALGVSYPGFVSGMVVRFLNASTADGYNPYRLTKTGFDWEKPDPQDPWANIGYWGDHQIIYLQKLLEWAGNFFPSAWQQFLTSETGVYAELPYRIRSYEDIIKNPRETIDYDEHCEQQTAERVDKIGTDGQLLRNRKGEIHRVCLLEKLLVPALVKMSNFVPDGGIWLNTQRPEWNDANNALVGNGASVVTVCHLRRFFCFLSEIIGSRQLSSCNISKEVLSLFENLERSLEENLDLLDGPNSDQERRRFVDQLQVAGSNYRYVLYGLGLSGEFGQLDAERIKAFADRCIRFLDQTIRTNKRADGLFHSYNLLQFDSDELRIDRLQEMLEGQVAALSSKLLSPEEAITVLVALRKSKIYRQDINSYLLYPDRKLPRFTEKNCLSGNCVQESMLIQRLIECNDQRIICRDVNGQIHFNGDFRNAQDLAHRLEILRGQDPEMAEIIDQERELVLDLFEQTFNHRQFTGRSGAFFGYEGLGCVYWHMVSKLALAVLENYENASQQETASEHLEQLRICYREIRDGLGLTSSPADYGAFPIDPYSHTPGHAGVQQPGMTGQVKEDILARLFEIGIRIREGVIVFDPWFFESSEFLTTSSSFKYTDALGKPVELHLAPGSFAFTFCQVPIVFRMGEQTELRIFDREKDQCTSRNCNQLTVAESRSVFLRDGTISLIEFAFAPTQ